ncbi:hypothetical protein GE061_008975 [Apolygus lucorum]|uniref:Transposase Tc1-like domain-containing protein n=1 Tax=Apolygus lucorum TaxID=248454 RepID=A0A6A4JY00_APOLU|nr:hypothetical protein GE061_008975 [Apolygus lucorum]
MGRGTDLSPRKKALVACMLDQGESSQREIAKKLKISQKSVSRVKVSVQEETPLSPDRKGKCVRKSKFSPRLLRKMVQIAKTNRRATSREICEKLKEYGTEVSPSIVRRRLCAEGLPARRPRKKAKLTPAMAKKRILWAKDMQEKFQNNWNKVVFSDESIFSVGEESGQYVRRTTSEMFDPKIKSAHRTKSDCGDFGWGDLSGPATTDELKHILSKVIFADLKDKHNILYILDKVAILESQIIEIAMGRSEEALSLALGSSYDVVNSNGLQILPIRPKAIDLAQVTFPPLFTERLKITKDKFTDLQSMKPAIDKDAWYFYDNMPHEEATIRVLKRQKKTEGGTTSRKTDEAQPAKPKIKKTTDEKKTDKTHRTN